MKTLELLEVEHALERIEQVLLRCGDEGQYLILRAHGDKEGGQALTQQRLAARKSLAAAQKLLAVATALMDDPSHSSDKEAQLQIKASIEALKLAARGAYEASHFLVGVRRSYG
ncbi:hypothetical protein [Variovorax sp. OV329]|uniref:hypothetical protein n=1 Tax=Variovorax sp. OV329 TaxID=1882825 RepID=UPI0008EF7957|nr:hypothetical protein [Variovorax sp. OV329]SFM20771.1 hypothetical protein SAMN05444747_103328 [Variovorax sp. OV329]